MFFIFITKFYFDLKYSNAIQLGLNKKNKIFFHAHKRNCNKTGTFYMYVNKFHNSNNIRKPKLYLLRQIGNNTTNTSLKSGLTKTVLVKTVFTKATLKNTILFERRINPIARNPFSFALKHLYLSLIGDRMQNSTTCANLKSQFVIQEQPAFINERLQKYNELKEKKKAEAEKKLLEEKDKENDVTQSNKTITIELLDGTQKTGERDVTTPLDIAKSISKKLAEDCVVARVTYIGVDSSKILLCDIEDEKEEGCAKNTANDKEGKGILKSILWDMNVPLIGNCKLELLNFENEEAKKVFWHSSAHILGSALEKLFGGYLTIGPALKEGFYYDIFLGEFTINDEHYSKIENEFNNLVKQNADFEKLICTKEEVLELFKYNPFKLELIRKKIPDGNKTSVYKCGNFIDLCLGPHIKSTGKIKGFKALKNSSVYWLGDKNNESLQRVYGISFPKKTELTEYLKMLEEAKKRDHRNVGKILNFFFFEKDASPGSCFWLPKGAKIYNKLIEFIRREYRLRNYEEVVTPNVYSCDLWKTSGHYQNYKDCMFIFNVENKEWGMKPMNCPGHCLMFKQMNLSYRSLPLRLADFGVLHRNEISGSLSGLTRVRRFQQDDSHIFCAHKHIRDEVKNTLHFIFYVYDLFNFKYELFLSTRPEKYIGKIEVWDAAERELKSALDSMNIDWKLNEGDGAFYGPKIDIVLKDSLNRTHQCGTIQLDFQLPIRFNLQYKSKDLSAEENESAKNPNAQSSETTPRNASKPIKEGSFDVNGEKDKTENVSSKGLINKLTNCDTNGKTEQVHDQSSKADVTMVSAVTENGEKREIKEEANGGGVYQKESEGNAVENVHNKHVDNETADGEEGLKKGFERPIIIHRAILGSVERFIAILIEHTAGKLPFWISPRQAIVLPVSDKYNDYANYVCKTLNNHSFDVEVDLSVNTLNKKIREAQLKQFNFILVVGEKEVTTQTVTLRDRDDSDVQTVLTLQQLITNFQQKLQVNSEKLNQFIPYSS